VLVALNTYADARDVSPWCRAGSTPPPPALAEHAAVGAVRWSAPVELSLDAIGPLFGGLWGESNTV
jgi:hypothetical protein